MSSLYGNGIELTEKTLDFLWGRQSITLNNITNVDTPGYKTKYMTFEGVLQKKLQSASKDRHPKSFFRGPAACQRGRVYALGWKQCGYGSGAGGSCPHSL